MRARPVLWGEGLGNDPSYPAAPNLLQAVSERRSYRWIARGLGISKNIVLDVVKQHRQAG